VLSHDQENDPDIVAMVAASAALTLSGAPFMGPIGGARVGFINNEYVLNPTLDEMKESQLDLVVAGTHDAVMMVESEAKELSEEIMLGAVMFGHRHFQPVIQAIIKLAEKGRQGAARPHRRQQGAGKGNPRPRREGSAHRLCDRAQAGPPGRRRRGERKGDGALLPRRRRAESTTSLQVAGVFKELEAKIVRWNILDTGKRIDGRDVKTVRPIVAEVGILPRTHGSALFTRGETQAMVVTTLGTAEDEQFIDALQGTYKETFLLHYNFPPYSVGETGRMGAPGPPRDRPRQARLARHPSDAAVEGRVPLHHPHRLRDHRVERLVIDGDGVRRLAGADGRRRAAEAADRRHRHGPHPRRQALAVLSDILGDEDHLGDMDFKVAGTEGGVTSLQMDIKIAGITEEIMKVALAQAKDGRLHILGEMAKAITARADSANTPRASRPSRSRPTRSAK
jgi:polyribonucleotide nucleotidyltransferase